MRKLIDFLILQKSVPVLFFLGLILWPFCPLFAESNRFSVLDSFADLEDPYFFNTQTSDYLPAGNLLMGLSGQYVSRPFEIISTTGARLRSGVEDVYFSLGSLRFAFSDSTSLGVKIPFVYQAAFTDPTVAGAPPTESVNGLGDLVVSFRYTPFSANKNGEKKGFGLFTFVTVPTGREDKYLADEHPVGGLIFIGDYQLFSRFRMALNVGMDFRERILLRNIDYSHRLLLNVGASQRIFKSLFLSTEVKIRTSMNDFFTEEESSPVEFYGGLSVPLARMGVRALVGAGSCVVCGVQGSRFRAMLNIIYDFSLVDFFKKPFSSTKFPPEERRR